jgi:catechol 2,3-dioxygenase-like lactoylglutathione lyase family enzyme
VLSGADLVAFAASTDLDAAEAFYGGVLGLELVDSTPFAKVFDAHGTQLRVTRVDAVAGAAYTVLGWRVEELDAAVATLRSRGVEPLRYEGMEQDESGAWTAPGGSRIAWFADPDGNTLSLQQAP